MRSVWAGAVSFGLVNIPVRLYPATQPREVAFRQVHREDGGKISFRRVCQACGRDVPFAGVAKGYERPGGDVVMLSDEELAGLPRERAHRIEVLSFTRPHQIDPILAGRSYYLEPEESAARAYVVFAGALQRTGKVAVVTVTLRQRESLAGLRARNGVLVLQTLLAPSEIAAADFPFSAAAIDLPRPELRMAMSLIDAMTEDFDPAAHSDRYRSELEDLVRSKVPPPPSNMGVLG
jgi:DNA end-binding protein Ku